MRRKAACPVCAHQEAGTIDRFLALPEGTPGKRGPRSLAKPFGLDRRDIARHERECLVGERREEVERDIGELSDEAVRREYRRKEQEA